MRERTEPRRSMLSLLGATAAGLTFGSRSGAAQAPATAFQPARHPQDEWLDRVPGRHRTVIDCATVSSAGQALLFAYNLYAANNSGYQLADRDVAIVICLRHDATVFAYNDAMWAKYGDAISRGVNFTDPKTRAAARINVLNVADYDPSLTNMGVTIAELVAKGVQFAVCGMATRGSAEIIAKATKGNGDAIYKELAVNLIPNSHLMAAGVVAINRAQEYGYTLLTAS